VASPPTTPPAVDVSIIIPMYNEEASVDRLFARLAPVLRRSGLSYEVVCVNDGSQDATLDRLLKLQQHDRSIRIVDLTRNFGKDTALTAGIDHARGAAVIPIDADLQDPPELIQELIARWREGFEVVSAVRQARIGESWTKRVTAALFYRAINRVSEVRVPPNTGDFCLLDRRVVDSLAQLTERTRFMKGLFAWVGYRHATVRYDRGPRAAGSTKWNYWRLWNYAIDGIVSFSSAPLKVSSYVGLTVSVLAFLYALFLILHTAVQGRDVPGYASVMVAVLFLGGIQLLSLGVIGEYLARVYNEVKRRPLYLVRDVYDLDDPPGGT
jgi:glycosyltransferase involved in cell wall biosynthesis